MSSAWRWFVLAAAVVAADQATKALVLARFSPGEGVVLTSYFNMVLVYNKGAAFSFLSDAPGWQTPLLVGFALVAMGVVAYLLVRSPGRGILNAGLALILGGAVPHMPWVHLVGIICLWAAAALTLITGYDYLRVGLRHMD